MSIDLSSNRSPHTNRRLT